MNAHLPWFGESVGLRKLNAKSHVILIQDSGAMKKKLGIILLFVLLIQDQIKAQIYKTNSECILTLEKQGSDAESIKAICNAIVTETDKQKLEEKRIEKLKDKEKADKDKDWADAIESWKNLKNPHLDSLVEYCQDKYKRGAWGFYPYPNFNFNYPECKQVIPYLRAINPNIAADLSKYCLIEYKRLTRYYSDFDFSYRYPECAYTIPSLRNQMVNSSTGDNNNNSVSQPQPAAKGVKLEKPNQKDAKKKNKK
jgi:hypothetical protein